MNKILIIILSAVLFTTCAFADTQKLFLENPIKIHPQVNKTEFIIGEPLEGQILIENGYANGVPNVFIVKLFHNDKEFNSYTISVPRIPMGDMTLTFRACGIPELTQDIKNVGDWKIVVYQQNTVEELASSIKFKINPHL